jgi:hypothetical protein
MPSTRGRKVSESVDRQYWNNENARLRLALAREGRLLFLIVVVIILVGGGIGTFFFFRHLASADLVAARQLIEQVQNDDETQRKQVNAENIKIDALETELARTKADLESIRPDKNKYDIPPNESLIIDGRLTVGLVGSPAIDSVILSIDGKSQPAVAGQVIDVAPEPATHCQVRVRSFDMVKVTVNASCAAAKPQ